ncbi:MAG: alpha/beta fold hydrolase [Ruminococcus flavefaciens]|nr:alpha/beta fold hydrolase [Ruminococcus flavefaciens]
MADIFQCGRIPDNETARLFCFHYAGGGASFFDGWDRFLPDDLGIYPYQLAGRGTRISEPVPDSLEDVAREAVRYIKELPQKPLLLAGHSMGAVIAYLTAYILLSEYGISAERLIVSASAPDFSELERVHSINMSSMSDDDFCNTLIKFGAVDSRIFRVKNFREIYLPVIRNDFRMTENFRADRNSRLDCGINVYGGADDLIVSPSSLSLWRYFTDGETTVRLMDGGHFFIRQHYEEICNDICSIL